MKVVRVEVAGGERFYGILRGDVVTRVEGDIFGGWKAGGEYGLPDCRLLAPVQPGKIVCVGVNYRDHAVEMEHVVPPLPLLFLKPSTAVIGPGDEIAYPAMSRRVDYESELAAVIGKPCRDVPEEEAEDYVFGYTCLNDVTARDLQKNDGQWTRAKGFDTFCPIGPHIETEIGWKDLRVVARLNGKVVQDGDTGRLVNGVPRIISFASQVMTLLPGDVIATGTPGGIGPMLPGDEIEVEVQGIGILRNRVV